MFSGTDWMSDWNKAETFSLRIGEICAAIPQRGSWEPNDRIAFAMASFRLAQEHHSATLLLFRHDKPTSANALARPLLEAGFRTIWLIEDASDQEIKAIVKGRAMPIFGELNSRLSKRSELSLSGKHQGLLHTLTHGGTQAIAGQYLDGGQRERLNAAMAAQAGYALAAGGYSVAQWLGRQDILTQFVDATPIVD
jgi:hypothetical protein